MGAKLFTKKKYQEKIKSRPQLEKMIDQLRSGDVVACKLSRSGSSLRDLIDLVSAFREKGVEFVSLKDGIDTGRATGRFTFNIFASLAEYEREIIRKRTMVGLAAASQLQGQNGRQVSWLKQGSLGYGPKCKNTL